MEGLCVCVCVCVCVCLCVCREGAVETVLCLCHHLAILCREYWVQEKIKV